MGLSKFNQRQQENALPKCKIGMDPFSKHKLPERSNNSIIQSNTR